MIYLTCDRWIDLEAGTRCQLVDGHDGVCRAVHPLVSRLRTAALVWRAGHIARTDEPQSIASNGTGSEA
jgi:hypothetical protein